MRAIDDPLDVCFVLPSLEPGGAERVTVNLANGLSGAGIRVRVLLTGAPGPLAAGLSPDVLVVALQQGRVRHAIHTLIATLRRSTPDVVISTHVHVSLLLCALRPLLPRRLVLVVREPTYTPPSNDPRDRRVRRWQRVLYRQADLVLATSEMMRADLADRVGSRVRLLPNPVDERRLRDGVVQASASPVLPAGRLLVAVGRLVPVKAYPDLLAAFAHAAGPGDALTVFGEGPERAHLEQVIHILGLEGRVSLRGVDPDLWTYLAASDAMVLASTREGMPNAALEALALGVPVIATTDLAVLEDVRRSAPDGAVTLVPRDGLADALRAVPRYRTTTATAMRPSLLPAPHRIDTVIVALRQMLEEATA